MQWLESIDAFCTLIIHKYEHQAQSFNPLLCMHTRGNINMILPHLEVVELVQNIFCVLEQVPMNHY